MSNSPTLNSSSAEPANINAKVSVPQEPNTASSSPQTPTSVPSSQIPAKNVLKPTPKKFVVKTNGAVLWKKAIDKRDFNPPYPYPDCKTPFHRLPTDVFREICYYLNAGEICSMILTGNKELKYRLTKGGVLDKIKLQFLMPPEHTNRSPHDTQSIWPSWLSDCDSLESFTIEPVNTRCVHNRINFLPLGDLKILPISIKSLKLRTVFNMGEIMPELARFPSLTTLELGCRIRGDLPTLSLYDVPENVVSLKVFACIHNWTETVGTNEEWKPPACWKSLRHLELPNMNYTSNRIIQTLPNELESFIIPTASLSSDLFQDLPRFLKSLSFTYSNLKGTDLLVHLLQLPPDLTSLSVKSAPKFTNEVLHALPQNLTSLRLRKCEMDLPKAQESWPLSKLTNLDFKHHATMSSFFLNLLPRNMTSLSVSIRFTNDGLVDLPPALTHLKLSDASLIDDSFASKINSSIKSLFLMLTPLWSKAAIAQLPRGITKLGLGGDYGDDILSALPPKLIELDLPSSRMITNSGIALLPRTLEKLRAAACGDLSIACIPNLPPRIQQMHIGFDTSPIILSIRYNKTIQEKQKSKALHETLVRQVKQEDKANAVKTK